MADPKYQNFNPKMIKLMFWICPVIGLILCCIVLPAVLSLVFSEIMRKLGWIKYGDQKLEE